MFFMEETPERSGAPVARYTMLPALLKAPSIVVQVMFPHCSIDLSLAALAESAARLMRPSPPVTATV